MHLHRTPRVLISAVLSLSAALLLVCTTGCDDDDDHSHVIPPGLGSIIVENDTGDDIDVFINGVELMLAACMEAYEIAGAAQARRVIGVPHQPSGKLLKTLIAAARKDLPDVEFLNNLPGFGNTLSSTIPTVLSRMEEVTLCNERPTPETGDVLLLPAAGICMERRDDHMTQGYAAISWQAWFPCSFLFLASHCVSRRLSGRRPRCLRHWPANSQERPAGSQSMASGER